MKKKGESGGERAKDFFDFFFISVPNGTGKKNTIVFFLFFFSFSIQTMGVAASSLLRPVGSKQYYQREAVLLEKLSADVSRLEVRRSFRRSVMTKRKPMRLHFFVSIALFFLLRFCRSCSSFSSPSSSDLLCHQLPLALSFSPSLFPLIKNKKIQHLRPSPTRNLTHQTTARTKNEKKKNTHLSLPPPPHTGPRLPALPQARLLDLRRPLLRPRRVRGRRRRGRHCRRPSPGDLAAARPQAALSPRRAAVCRAAARVCGPRPRPFPRLSLPLQGRREALEGEREAPRGSV